MNIVLGVIRHRFNSGNGAKDGKQQDAGRAGENIVRGVALSTAAVDLQ